MKKQQQMDNFQPVLAVEAVTKHYKIKRGIVHAVDGVDLVLHLGETLALVGESGCGKSTLSRLMMCLEAPSSGNVVLNGENMAGLKGNTLRKKRRKIQMIFQDPYACLNPRMNSGQIVREPLDNFHVGSLAERKNKTLELLRRVGIRDEFADRYPHELSGGQRQRLGIARALALEPQILIADEPVSALDVSVQAQVINLLVDLQRDFNLSILLVSHDINVVAHISQRIAVMYVGKIVEVGNSDGVLNRPLHPYSQALLEAVPVSHPRERRDRILVEGDIPSPVNPPPGCRYHPRCHLATDRCRGEEPHLREVGGRSVACHFAEVNEKKHDT